MWGKNKQINGFTIVELLIVIVVIGILAAITIVAYNGIQNRATNQQTVASVRAYYSAIKAYGIDNGRYPSANACLGSADFYTSNPCYIGNNTYAHNATLNNALNAYMTSPPTLSSAKIIGSTYTGTGIFYYISGQYVGFPILGSTTCPAIAGATEQSKAISGSDVYCRYDLPPL